MMTDDMHDILKILDDMKRTLTATNASLERILDDKIALDLATEKAKIRQTKLRLEELADRVSLKAGRKLVYRTKDLPDWLIDGLES